MEAQYEDKQRGLFAGSVQEGGGKGEEQFPDDPPMKWPESPKKPDLKIVSAK